MPLVMCERQTSSWLFSWFPRRFFFPLHSASMAFKPMRHGRAFPKIAFVSYTSDVHTSAARRCSFCGMTRGAFQLSAHPTCSHTQRRWLLAASRKMHGIGKAQRINMDYLPAIGKTSAWSETLLCVRMHVEFDSFLFSLVMWISSKGASLGSFVIWLFHMSLDVLK